MTVVVLRATVLLGLVALTWWAVNIGERGFGARSSSTGHRLVLITGEGCRLCGPAERALRARGARVEQLDLNDDHGQRTPRALPAAVVLDEDGGVVMRRTGRSVIDDAALLAAAVAPSADRA